METGARGWIPVPLGRLVVHVSWTFPALVAGLMWAVPEYARLYLLAASALLVHELGHALAALSAGGRTSDVRIHALYGRAWVPQTGPRCELLIALAGPLANAIGAVACWGAGGVFRTEFAEANTASLLLMIHTAIGVGNLVPVGPTDGGRIRRAWGRIRAEGIEVSTPPESP